MKIQINLFLFFLLVSIIIFNCESPEKPESPDVSISGAPVITLPAIYNPELIQVMQSSIIPPAVIKGHYTPVGNVYDITYNGTNIDFGNELVELSYSYNADQLYSEGLIKEFMVYYYANGEWYPVNKCYDDTVNNTVVAYTSHFTPFVLTALEEGSETVSKPPINIYDDFPLGIGGTGNADFMIVDENFRYYQDRDYFVVPAAGSTVNEITFETLGFYGAMGIATCNGDSEMGLVTDHKQYTGDDYVMFTAHMDLDVYVMYDTRGGLDENDISEDAPWLTASGFTADLTTDTVLTPTRFFLETTDAVGLYTVYRKSYNQGEVIHLHGNRKEVTDAGINTNYWVILKRQGVYESEPASILCSANPDITPPDNVTELQAVTGAGSITLSWKNPVDTDFAGVVIRKSTDDPPVRVSGGYEPEGEVLSPESYRDDDVTVGTTYYYTVFALDVNQNYHEGGNYISVTVPSIAPDLNGIVRDTFNNPVAGAYIRLYNESFTEYTYSDVNGYYEFLLVPPGTYNLVAKRDDFTIFTTVVTITS